MVGKRGRGQRAQPFLEEIRVGGEGWQVVGNAPERPDASSLTPTAPPNVHCPAHCPAHPSSWPSSSSSAATATPPDEGKTKNTRRPRAPAAAFRCRSNGTTAARPLTPPPHLTLHTCFLLFFPSLLNFLVVFCFFRELAEGTGLLLSPAGVNASSSRWPCQKSNNTVI